ncbi:MAG: S8 family serine peptidase, partial [Anaerolineae bacterium]|nr:S8 family serine peptidase [Anaerolineae bacterium]
MAQRKCRFLVLVALLLTLLSLTVAAKPPAAKPPAGKPPLPKGDHNQAYVLISSLPLETRLKIEPQLLKEFLEEPSGASAEKASSATHGVQRTFLVHLRERADLRPVVMMSDKQERRRATVARLQEIALYSQGPVLSYLEARSAEGKVSQIAPYWIFNGLAITADLDTLLELAARPDVEMIRANHVRRIAPVTRTEAPSPQDLEWSVEIIRADLAWQAFGVTGKGIVVANMDTGVDWQHPALQRKYRGYNETDPDASEHDYNWFDFTGTYPNEPGPREAYISNVSDHGTHTMGIMVGSEADGSNQVGVAPGARWIAVKVFDDEGCSTDADIHAGFQWMLAPTDLNGDSLRPDLAPDVVSNSWGDSNGSDISFWDDILAWRAAGIMSAFSSGNDGSNEGTVGSPASFPFAFSVGATDRDDRVASFSSRGPSPWGQIKPEVTAPGSSIRSTIAGGGYEGGWNGTSMAAPHVAGLTALLLQADRQYNGMVDLMPNPTLTLMETERVITSTVVHPANQVQVPDNHYGWGRIDAYQAVGTVVESGTFLGRVTDAVSGAPIGNALITMRNTAHGGETHATADVTGYYTFSVAAGVYDVTAAYFGYASRMARDMEIIAHTATQLDFALDPFPNGTISGRVISVASGQPLAATISLSGTPASCTTDASGYYTFTAPAGDHDILVWPSLLGHRGSRQALSVVENQVLDFGLEIAPRILLVDADRWVPASEVSYYEDALHDLLYPYHVHAVETMDAVPTADDLNDYDLVIWSQPVGSPGYIGAWGGLSAYMDGGGRLFISGQDIGYWDDYRGEGSSYYRDYLHARYVADDAGATRLTGRAGSIMADVALDLNTPDSAQNQSTPSEISSADLLAIPILDYEGDGVGGLQADNCTHRVVYLAFGLGGSGPVAARIALLDRALEWLTAPTPTRDVQILVESSSAVGDAGSTAVYRVTVTNLGLERDSYDLHVSDNIWPVSIWEEGGNSPISHTDELDPCETQNVEIRVEVPVDVLIGQGDDVAFVAASRADPSITANLSLSTVFFPSWEMERPMPMPRYRHTAISGRGCVIYVLGGFGGEYWDIALDVAESYDVDADQWETLADKPTAVGNAGAAMLDGLIYVVGGYDDTLQDPYLNVVEVYDPAENRWVTVSPLPQPLCGAAVAAANGSLYVFGGNASDGSLGTTYAYDPQSDTWTEKRPMPGGARAYATAALLNDRIYVAGGWPALTRVESYDPVGDSWSSVAPMLIGRQSSGLVAHEGYLYVIAGGQGWDALTSAERYDPVADRWQMLSELQSTNRTGCAAAVAGARIFALGGTGAVTSGDVESLLVGSSLGLSQVTVDREAARTGDTLTYHVLLRNSSGSDVERGELVNPVPEHTTYVLGSATGGAIYDELANQITWEGGVGGGSSRAISFQATIADGLPNNTVITNTARISDEACGRYTRTATTIVQVPDLSPSSKSVDKTLVAAGNTLEYTIRLLNASPFTLENTSLVDPVPVGTEYVEGSAQGGATYDPVQREVRWQGRMPAGHPGGPGYWEDSDRGDVQFDWIDATGGTLIPAGDDASRGPYDLGFRFGFCGQEYSQFYVNTNGQVLFGDGAWTPMNAAIPDTTLPNNFIAAFWDDLDPSAGGAIYYRTFGTSPQRYTVVQWADVPRYGTADRLTFEVVLYEGSGEILVQYLSLEGPTTDGDGATVGVENMDGTDGVQYLYNGQGPGFPLHDRLAVRFVPSRVFIPGEHSIAFQVQVGQDVLPGSTITNTVAIVDGEGGTYQRQAGTMLEGPDLSPSTKLVDQSEASSGDTLSYSIRLINRGTASASDVSVVDPIPAGTTYLAGTVSGGAHYDADSNSVRWNGEVPRWSGLGYTWMDNDDGGVQYDWIDVTAGQVVPPADDASRGPYPLGFTFTFYDQEYTEFYVNTNGQVLFGRGESSYSNQSIPSPGSPDNFIAPFWDDLAPHQRGNVYYATYGIAPDCYAVIAWEDVPTYGGGNELTFEVVLRESDNSILLQYRSLSGATAGGANATVGIENATGDEGIQYVFNGSGPGYPLHDGLAVLIAPEIPCAELGFQVALDAVFPAATHITNTATIVDGGILTYERSSVTLVNPVGLDLAMWVSAEEAAAGEVLTYAITLTN